jgi:YD repeat-containing protein
MNKQPLRVLLLVALSVGSISKFANAQTQAAAPGGVGVTAPSAATAPGAASASLSGISSPSIFNGSTNIKIPIHEFSLDNQDYSIFLGYNTQGVKIDETVSPAGLHWNIYAEGSITRMVKDLPDELNLETSQTIPYYDQFNQDQTDYPNHKRYLKGKMVTYTEDAAQQAVADVYRDTECDDFIFSCGGKSFTFNLGNGMNIFTHPHQNIKVTPLIDGVPIFLVVGQTVGNWGSSQASGILEFLVRDEQGTQYLFTRGDYQAIPLYNNDYGNDKIADAYATSRWVIKKVTFANGNEINYNYSLPEYTSTARYYKENYAKEIWAGNVPASAEYLGEQIADGQTRFCQLTSILYPNGTQAEFIYNSQNITELYQKMLDEIKISSGTQCLRYKLNQSKVNNRWFLNSVKQLSCDGTTEEPYYSFEYNPLALPERFNTAQDYYGYYNGDPTGLGFYNNGTPITIPKHNAGGGSLGYGNERLPDPAFAVAANLIKVKNAFGGEVSFRYSGNTAANPFVSSSVQLPGESNYFMGASVADGLKVDSVIETEKYHPENSKITVYQYIGGQLFMPGGYFHYPDYIDSATNNWQKVLFQSMFLTSHQLIGGSNHGYSTVTENYYTSTGEILGKKQTTFSNVKDVYSNNQLNYYKIGKHYFEYPYTEKQYLKDWAIGLPMKVMEYDQNNRIVKEVNNFYNITTDNSASAYISNTRKISVNSGNGPYIGNGDNGYPGFNYANKKIFTDTYYPYTGFALLRCAKVKTYVSDSRFLEDSTLYTYDDRNNLKNITTQNSKGEKVNTVNVYNYDVAGTGVPGGPIAGSVLYNMTDAGLEKVVSIERWKQALSSSVYDQTLIGSLINTFTYQGGILKPKAVFDLKVDVPLGYTPYTGMSMGSPVVNPYSKVIEAFQGTTIPQYMEKSTDIKLTDSKANPLETQVNNMDLYKSMIWDTNTGNKLAEVAGAQYADIAFSGFESTVKGNLQYNEANIISSSTVPAGGISGDHVLKAFGYEAPITHPGLTPGKEYTLTFWSNIGGATFGGAGLGAIPITVVYSPGNGWQLFTARFTPVNNSPLGFMANGSNFPYYLDDVRIYPSTATMQTYNYTSLFGTSSTADGQGHITYYEYDKLGRPTLVRDQQGNIISKTKVFNGGGL